MPLASQARQILVWMDGSKFNYIIPLYSGLESVLGANLEVSLDLSQSAKLHRIYSGLVRTHKVEQIAATPKNVIPLDLSLGFERQRWKTVLKAEEVSLRQQKKQIEQSYVDLPYEERGPASLQLR